MTQSPLLSWRRLTRAERICLIVLLATPVVCLLLPYTAQDQAYHTFADRRALLGIPNAADVFSNVAFLLVGTIGIMLLRSSNRARFPATTEASLWCVMLGLLGTAAGSAWYHVDPNDATLFWDRLPMTLIFTGVICAALAQRVGGSVARAGLALLFGLGIASVVYWRVTGNLSPYLTLQFGGIVALLTLLLATPRAADPFPWAWVIAWYALAKVVEVFDERIWQASGGLVAGHTLKHIAGAAAGAALLMPLASRAVRRASAT
jgi:hypothetical protein